MTACTTTRAVESSGMYTTASIAATRTGSAADAKAAGENPAAVSSKLRSPSSSAFDRIPNFSMEERVNPSSSALDNNPAFSTLLNTLRFSSFLNTSTFTSSLPSKNSPAPNHSFFQPLSYLFTFFFGAMAKILEDLLAGKIRRSGEVFAELRRRSTVLRKAVAVVVGGAVATAIFQLFWSFSRREISAQILFVSVSVFGAKLLALPSANQMPIGLTVDDGVVMDGDKNGGLEESSPDSKEKISVEFCPASDLVVNNSDSGQTQAGEAVESKCDTRANSNLGNHDCLIAMNDTPDTIRTEASHGSYVHPLILLQNQVLSKINADKEDALPCISQNQNSPSAESSCDLVTDSEKTKLINMSPIDELEGELVYYQHHLLCNAVSRKHLSDDLISKVIKVLPQEIETLRKRNWDAVLVSQYLSEVREVKKQGRKERRHKEAQAVLAAATAAAAASSRLSSFRKDTLEESTHLENKLKIKAFGGRSAVHAQPKETHPKLSVTWTPPEMNIDSLPSTLDYKGHSRVCDVCRREETILNPVIICSSCKVAVHIDCYRSVKDSTGPWFCELCEDSSASRNRGVPSFSYSEKPSRVAECCLCGGTTGAFRKSTDGQWVHAFCAEWVLESTFRRGQLKPIQGMETISRGNDVCLVCSCKVGACIKCNYGHCQSTFHPTCGKSAGFFMNVRTSGGKIQHKAYCEKHSLVERTKAETQKHGVEEWNSLKKVRVELERLRLICERIIRREKLKRELVICSHDMVRWNRELVCSSSSIPRGACTGFVSPDVSSESATTSLRGGYTNSYKSCSETIIQRSDDITIDSTATVAGKRRIRFPIAMDNDQKTDDSSTSQIFTQIPSVSVRPMLSGKQIPIRPRTDDGDKFFRHGKHTETFEKELVMTSDQATMRNQRLPKGFVYVPIRVLSNENEETVPAAVAPTPKAASSEENSGQ